ncbi:unnamed protein product [Peronospora destructor]|uniref:Uncharacterized protein n=1 Tax=Peronospora destructor TaxID=86335 RepID=A0AAV0UJQ3_9STRA|nr:unnamed protein product [Peronospora destructor]
MSVILDFVLYIFGVACWKHPHTSLLPSIYKSFLAFEMINTCKGQAVKKNTGADLVRREGHWHLYYPCLHRLGTYMTLHDAYDMSPTHLATNISYCLKEHAEVLFTNTTYYSGN